ncbi:MAG: MBL fold metallo-hydrolase [Candidatus Acetothermia bacterium]
MKIKWFGHSCFSITDQSGTQILTDPYDESLDYPPLEVSADLVTVSHGHFDHNAVDRVSGSPNVVKDSGVYNGVEFEVLETYHDKSRGAERGENRIFHFEFGGYTFGHFGDLGHMLEKEALRMLEDLQLAFVPTGGYYTIGPEEAAQLVGKLPNLQVIIPMHYKTEVLSDYDFPLAGVDEFCQEMEGIHVCSLESSEHHFQELPDETEIWIFQHGK